MKERSYRYLNLVTAIFVTTLITANIMAVKLVDLGGLVLPAAVVIFPVSYIFGDILTEVYGYARSRHVIWIGFACNALVVVAFVVGGLLPAAEFWDGQAAWDRILGYTPRILAASFVAYLVGEFLNSFVLAKLKVATHGRWLWLRTISSTLLGQGADSWVFITLAFAGTIPPAALLPLIMAQWVFKVVYEIVATPLTYGLVGGLKRAEHEDYYDTETNFNPFKLNS